MEKRHIGYEIHSLSNMLDRLISAYCSRLSGLEGLNQMQCWIIGYLYSHTDQYIFQRDLEKEFHMARSTATGLLHGMEKKGFLMRIPYPDDGRLKRLMLTEKGISLQLAIIQCFETVDAMITQKIPPENLDSFFQNMDQIRQNIRNDPCFPQHSPNDICCCEHTAGPEI